MEIFNKEKFIKQWPVSITKDNGNMWQRMSAFNFEINNKGEGGTHTSHVAVVYAVQVQRLMTSNTVI